MALTIADNYVSKSFGEYSLQVCKKTKYFNALHLLDVYNDSYEEKKIRKRMIHYMKRPKFINQVDADFDFIADKKLLDYEFLNSLMHVSQENTEDSDGHVLCPSQLTIETSETDIKALDKNIKYQYMVRKVDSGYNKILSLDINPMSAVGLAMWLSPAFGSKVKDVFLRFIEGDANLIKETIQNLNDTTDMVNNLETTTNPDTNEISILITTFEKNDYMAKIKNDRHKREIQQLIDEKNGVITKQKCQIDELLEQLKENARKAEERDRIADERYNNLIGYAANTNEKLNLVLPQRVKINMETDPNVEQVYISYDRNAVVGDFDLYVIRCQSSSYDASIARIRKKYAGNIVEIYSICFK